LYSHLIHYEPTSTRPSRRKYFCAFAHPADLLFQRLDGRKLDLIAQAIEEVNLNFSFR